MKKSLLLLFLASLALVTQAQEITVINEGSIQSPTTVFGLALKDAIGPDTRWVQASGCQDAQSKFKKIQNAVVIYNTTNDFAERLKNSSCQLDPITVKNAVIITTTYMKVCRALGSNRKLTDPGVTLGAASMVVTPRHQANWHANGVKLKLVPYGGSAGAAKAASIGEVDYGWVGSGLASKMEADGKLECLYSTDPASPKYLGKSFKLSVADFQIITVAYTNSTNPVVLNKLKQSAGSVEFSQWLAGSETLGNTNIVQQDVDVVNGYVTRLIEAWADK